MGIYIGTLGLVFLATPFGGTSFIDVVTWAEPGLKALAFIQAEKVSNLMDETTLKPELKRLFVNFTKLYRHISPSCMAAFYETGKMSLPRKLIPWLSDFLAQWKPNSRGRPLEKADAHISNKCYDANKLKIERISGDFLPMERCYVNLVIIEDPVKKYQGKQEGAPRASQFSLNSRLNIKTPDKNIRVNMQDLFGQREGDNMSIIEPKRILIRGHAGVGKSTLCKKIVHDFKELGMWRNMFTRILWLPLRNLKRLGSANC
ncbi:hypothetical protein GGR58DRAFT_502535 [Xylaria digitata]|nr:hypothetical protein GGR58DRAFT_502535 [Xylaria digitata]